MENFFSLKYKKFSFVLKFTVSCSVSTFPANTLRGGLGVYLKKTICSLKTKKCETCILKQSCIYRYLFETLPPQNSEFMKLYNSIPRPYLLDIEEEKGNLLNLNLTLFEKSIQYLPYFVLALQELGKHGLGKKLLKFRVDNVVALPEKTKIYDNSNNNILNNYGINKQDITWLPDNNKDTLVQLNFITPVSIKVKGRIIKNLTFRHLTGALLRRISAVSYFHGSGKWDIDYKAIVEEAENVQVISSDMIYMQKTRYSTRQKENVILGGIQGKIVFSGNIKPFINILKAGEIVGVGKGTSFGFGKYKLEE